MKPKDLDILYWQPIVEIIASKFPPPHRDDLISEGMVGLCEAAKRFKLNKGATFATYATHRIRGHMKDYLRGLLGKGCRRPTGRNKRLADIEILPFDQRVYQNNTDQLTIADILGKDGEVRKFMEYEQVVAAMDRCLSETEREYIKLRFGEGLYLKDVGKAMGVGGSRAYYVCRAAIRKLKEEMIA